MRLRYLSLIIIVFATLSLPLRAQVSPLADSSILRSYSLDSMRINYRALKLTFARQTPGAAVITENTATESLLQRAMARNVDRKITAYRVRIFFDNKQNSRAAAYETALRFRELFPEYPVNVSHENPYFKVTVGWCLKEEEAWVIYGRIRGAFEKAFIIREEVPVSAFGKIGVRGKNVSESTDVPSEQTTEHSGEPHEATLRQ